jgi:signal transduction histidine kinase
MAIGTISNKLPFWRQLRSNLIVLFVLMAVIPVMLVGYFTIGQIRTQTTQQVIRQLESVSVLKQAQLESWLDSGMLTLDVFLSHSASRNQILQLLAVPEQDEQATNSILSEALRLEDTNKTPFNELFVYNPNGLVRTASDTSVVGKLVTRQPYFKDSLLGSYIQPPYYELGTSELTMIETVPLFNDQKQLVGVLAARLDLAKLGSIMLERSGLGDTGETYLVSQESNYSLTPLRAAGYDRNRAYHSSGIDQALTGAAGSGEYTGYQGLEVIGAFRWIPELKTALIAEIDQTEALAPFKQTEQLVIELAVIAALIAVGLGLLSAARISAPIVALTQIATRISQGDLTQRAKADNRTESGVLAASFNIMTDQLVKNIDELDRKINEVEATNSALKIATARAKEAARVKGEFLANVSHELRTPLNAIIGFSDMLLTGMTGPLNDKQTHKLQRLKENGSRLLNLINDLLDLTRIESGRLEMVDKAFSPQSLAERMTAQMESLAVESNLKFSTVIGPDVPATVQGDEKRVEQVVVNLLSNAFKFTKEGSVTLSINANHKERTWSLEVIDTGIGVPPHAVNVIFEEFRQLDGSYSRAYKGSGLGLAITRNLVRMMGGKITVKSTLGSGSTFTVILPMSIHETTEAIALEAVAI